MNENIERLLRAWEDVGIEPDVTEQSIIYDVLTAIGYDDQEVIERLCPIVHDWSSNEYMAR